jgi:hypothetical protein
LVQAQCVPNNIDKEFHRKIPFARIMPEATKRVKAIAANYLSYRVNFGPSQSRSLGTFNLTVYREQWDRPQDKNKTELNSWHKLCFNCTLFRKLGF